MRVGDGSLKVWLTGPTRRCYRERHHRGSERAQCKFDSHRSPSVRDAPRLEWLLHKALEAGIDPFTRPPSPYFAAPYVTYAAGLLLKTDEAIETQLLAALTNDETLRGLVGTCFCSPNARTRIELGTILRWLLRRTLKTSPRTAVADLQAYIRLKRNPGLSVAALTGIEVDRPLRVGAGVSLIPFSSIPDSLPKRGLLDRPLGMILHHDAEPTAALVKRTIVAPHVASGEGPFADYDDQKDLQRLCKWLTVIGPSCPKIAAEWWQADQTVPFRDVASASTGQAFTDVGPGEPRKIVDADRSAARTLVKLLGSVDPAVEKRLRIPLQRLNQALRRRSLTDRAIDLGIALESLLLEGVRDELSFRLRIRGAWLLGRTPQERDAIMRSLRDVYECRSTAVHEGHLGRTIRRRDVSEVLATGAAIAAQVIIAIARHGWPDWDSLVLG